MLYGVIYYRKVSEALGLSPYIICVSMIITVVSTLDVHKVACPKSTSFATWCCANPRVQIKSIWDKKRQFQHHC